MQITNKQLTPKEQQDHKDSSQELTEVGVNLETVEIRTDWEELLELMAEVERKHQERLKGGI